MNNLRISGAHTNARSETDLSVNINDSDNIIGASNAIGDSNQAQFFSTDGGTTWNDNSLPLDPADSMHSDPALGWTADGTAWSATLGIDAMTGGLRLRVYKSTDNGSTWTLDATPSGAQTGVDRETLWVDQGTSSAFKDQIYVTYHNLNPGFVVRRTAGAGAAWQAPVQVTGAETTGSALGGDIKTNADGDVFVFWPDGDGSHVLRMAKSTDGGATFTALGAAPIDIATAFSDSRRLAVPSDDDRQARVFISAGAYRTATKDMVYAIWPDLTGDTGCTAGGPGSDVTSACKTRIWFSRSSDGGATWSAAKMINNKSSKNDQYLSKLAVDQTNGQLVLIYLDTVDDPGRLKTDLWMQTSDDDGVTWCNPIKITTAETDETGGSADTGNQYGEYPGLSGNAGVFHASWTDRRSGAAEEIWSDSVKTTKDSFFIIQRSTFGQDEVNGLLLQSPGAAFVPEAFWVVVEGFSAADLSINAGNQGNPPIKPTITFSPNVTTTGMTAHCTGVVPEDPSLPAAFQRFRFTYEIIFTSSDSFNFAPDTETVTLTATLNALGTSVISSGQLQLIKQANPYITAGSTSWLSIDLRVFQIKSGDSKFGRPMSGSDATAFIQNVMDDLTAGHGAAGGQTFENDLSTDEDTSAIQLSPTDDDGNAVFNFALARVRLTGVSTVAQNVRVFFRLFQAQSTSTAFDPGTVYRSFFDGVIGGHKIPLAGILNNEYVTVPCFAQARINTSADDMGNQPDDHNVITITPDSGGAEVDTFFGCWLDTNQPAIKVLPATPPAGNPDGHFSGTLQSVQEVISRSGHQCLVAEIAFDQVIIPNNADPSTSDKLAQRNLAFGPAPNPGIDASRRVPQTFEIKATNTKILSAGFDSDELMIDWSNFPAGTTAQIFLPALNAAEILDMANRRYNLHHLSMVDSATIKCKAENITYLPVPDGADINFAGLLTIDLPSSVKKGEKYNAVVRQVTTAFGRNTSGNILYKKRQQSNTQIDEVYATAFYTAGNKTTGTYNSDFINWRRIHGSFQLIVPISTKELLLRREEQFYSILEWIQTKMPVTSRWYPVFLRYLAQIGRRVSGFGGNPNTIEPSPYGIVGKPKPPHHKPEKGEERICFEGKVSAIIYDHFGDFEGFYLETEDGERYFTSREHQVEDIAKLAWRERIYIKVIAEQHAHHIPVSLILKRAPRPFQI